MVSKFKVHVRSRNQGQCAVLLPFIPRFIDYNKYLAKFNGMPTHDGGGKQIMRGRPAKEVWVLG